VDALDAILRAEDLVAVLGREVAVRLLEISASGCLLECNNRLDVGRHGSLRVAFEGREYTDDVRIMRCREVSGSSAIYHAGAEFVWTAPPQVGSLRLVLPKLQLALLKESRIERARRM
jgi:hypothetical protein